MNLFSKKPHKNVLRFWAMILTGAILMTSLSGCMGEKLVPTELSFSQVEYERPDGQGVLDLIDKAKEQAENPEEDAPSDEPSEEESSPEES